MNKKKLVNDVLMAMRSYNKRNIVKDSNKQHFLDLKNHGIEVRKLSSAQKAEIDSIYRKYGYKYSYDTHILTYSITGEIDAKILPEDMYRSSLELKLNNIDQKFVMSDKNYFELYMPEVKFPDVIVRNINGVFYDAERNIITKDDADKLISCYEKVVVKPSVENGSGRGVALVDVSNTSVTEKFGKNYVVQKLLRQHSFLSSLNQSSVNVIRVVTLFLDGKVVPLTAALRYGGEGSFTDNQVSKDGKGMTIIGITEDGTLREKGYFSCGESVTETPSGLSFGGLKIPKFEEMVALAVKQHSRFPNIRIIGWDFTLNEEEDVVVIEYNIKAPGVLYYQWVNGPLFGDKTTEILDKIKKLS